MTRNPPMSGNAAYTRQRPAVSQFIRYSNEGLADYTDLLHVYFQKLHITN